MYGNMRKLRKQRGLTQEKLAKIVNATKRQIGAWERGENELPMDYAVEIANALNCTLNELVGIDSGENADIKNELLEILQSISPAGQQQLLLYARFIAQNYPKNNQVFEAQTA